MQPSLTPKVGLVLTGGGARAAYQAGVLRAIADMLPKRTRNPFPVICGTSAGALNAASLALSARNFQEGVRKLSTVWENAHVSKAYRSDPIGAYGNAARWLASLLLGSLGKRSAVSLLDNSPLADLLKHSLPLRGIQRSIDAGALHALGITAWGYTSGQSVTFYQGADDIAPWKRERRIGLSARIGIEHLLASSAIPLLFPAVRLNREYFGDGSMRQLAPISPALHLGADRVLVIGVRKAVETQPEREKVDSYPTLAQIGGHVMGSIFLDSLDVDLERLQRINNTLLMIPDEKLKNNDVKLRRIESMVISPSVEINKIAAQYAHTLPRTLRLFYRAIGAMRRDGSALLSYVLFEEPFCRALIELGYQDAMPRRSQILQFLCVNTRQ
ncbi:NTE family protein [Nitrosospira briensis]|uniref:NTE family protein n=1 Tax=Nitrosospira briensis TaxID=35799 RepID=A0A1I5C183_9PROT|nr:patatin-like phospholipase family protein [Nitrosospira briensis]SFN80656.1 NTE family protein [Nitrosospira briensis]